LHREWLAAHKFVPKSLEPIYQTLLHNGYERFTGHRTSHAQFSQERSREFKGRFLALRLFLRLLVACLGLIAPL